MRYTLLAATMLVMPLATHAATQSTSCSQVFGNGNWSIQGNQLISPSGQPFKAEGVNVLWNDLTSMWTPGAPTFSQPLLQAFPGTNYVRILVEDTQFSSASAQALAPYIMDLNAHGIVVALEDWTYPATNLSAATVWYSQVASAFKGDSMVVYETENEPGLGQTDNEVQAIFSAIRSTGNNNLILINPTGGNSTAGMTPSLYQSLSGPWAWSQHQYAWEANYSDSTTAQTAALQANAANLEAIANKPIIIDEFGNSTDGANTDAGWQANVSAVLNSGYGWSAFGWNGPEFTGWGHPGGDQLLNNNGSLNAFGQMIAANMAANTLCGAPVSIPPAQVSPITPAISTAEPTPIEVTSPQQITSYCQNQTVAISAEITPGAGSFTDVKGNTYTINATNSNEADINSHPITPNGESTNTAAMILINGHIYGQDATTYQWFEVVPGSSTARLYEWQPIAGLPVLGRNPVITARWLTPQSSELICTEAVNSNRLTPINTLGPALSMGDSR